MAKKRRRRRPNIHLEEKSKSAFFQYNPKLNTGYKAGGAFFQAKLDIKGPSDPSEKEADAVASKVVNKAGKKGKINLKEKKDPEARKLQRMEAEEKMEAKLIRRKGEGEKEEIDAKMIQREGKEEEETAAKLIHKKGEKEEIDAKMIQREGKEEEETAAKLIHKKGEKEEIDAKLIQRETKEEEKPAAKLIQKKPKGIFAKLFNVSKKEAKGEQQKIPSLEELIEATKGKGKPLPEDIRSEMEAELEADFSMVRIHTDATAIKMTQMVNAHAFTHGFDIYFNKNRYKPETKAGKKLLAHELTHVVQQKGH